FPVDEIKMHDIRIWPVIRAQITAQVCSGFGARAGQNSFEENSPAWRWPGLTQLISLWSTRRSIKKNFKSIRGKEFVYFSRSDELKKTRSEIPENLFALGCERRM